MPGLTLGEHIDSLSLDRFTRCEDVHRGIRGALASDRAFNIVGVLPATRVLWGFILLRSDVGLLKALWRRWEAGIEVVLAGVGE